MKVCVLMLTPVLDTAANAGLSICVSSIDPESSRMNQTFGATASPDCSGTLGTLRAAWTGSAIRVAAALSATANTWLPAREDRYWVWLMALLRSGRLGAIWIILAR